METEYTETQMERSRLVVEIDELIEQKEVKELIKLLSVKGQSVGNLFGFEVISLLSVDFETVDQKIGLALLASACFQKPMSLNGVSLVEFDKAKINIVTNEEKLYGFWGEKFTKDDKGRNIYYVDIVGISNNVRSTGIGGALGEMCLYNFLENNRSQDTVILTRTQNPIMVGALKKCLPKYLKLYPFEEDPSLAWVESVNWLVSNGFISRNDRHDTHFDARESLIHWGAYGECGDGSTWENMIENYMGEIDWSKNIPIGMVNYLVRNGTSLEESLTRGHAFIVGGFIDRLKK
jgi:hypothetical protein